MADVEFTIDDDALGRLVGNSDRTRAIIAKRVDEVTARANAMSAGFRTGFYHRDHQSPAVGGTQPAYKGDVEKRGKNPVGIVVTGNYAAMKDNHLHNTLLKSL